MKRLIFEFLIRRLRNEFASPSKEVLAKESYDGLMSQLWQNSAFRKYVADRDAKIIFTLASGEGMDPEPREKYLIHFGRRLENLELAREAKQAFDRVERMKRDAQVKSKIVA